MLSLSFSTTLLVPAIYILASATYQIIYYRFFHPLSKFPGPFWASVTRLWIAYHCARQDELPTFQRLHEKHGPIVRITPTMLLVNDATKLPIIYHRRANKSQHYTTGSFGKTESIFNIQDHQEHARHRKLAAPPYSFSHVKKMEPLFDGVIGSWISKVNERFAATGSKFDFAPWASYMAFDVISEIGFGARIGFIEQEKDVYDLIQGFHDGIVFFGLMARLYPFTNWIKSTWIGEKYLVANPDQDTGFGVMMRFRDDLITQRYQDIKTDKSNGRIDLLQTFIEARDDDGQPLPLDYIKAEIMLVLLAGADTTGTAFQAIVLFILTNPDVYEKVMAEIDAATQAGHLSQIPQYTEVLEHCPYYMACVKETLRLRPSIPAIFPRLAPEGGLDLGDGQWVPEGTEVACNPWFVNRDKNIYGDDAYDFRPERWLESEERVKEYVKYSMSFGYGSRACLGRDIATMELYKAPLLFFRTFKLTMLNKEEPAKYHVKGGVSYFSDAWMKIERRPQISPVIT